MTYLLLYIIFSRYKLAFLTKTLHIFTLLFIKKHLSNRLSLNCLWYDLIPGPYLSCLCVKATSVYIYYDNLDMNRNLITSSNIGVKNHT